MSYKHDEKKYERYGEEAIEHLGAWKPGSQFVVNEIPKRWMKEKAGIIPKLSPPIATDDILLRQVPANR